MLQATGNILYFAPDDPNQTSETDSFSQDDTDLSIGTHSILETESISQETRDGGGVGIRIVER